MDWFSWLVGFGLGSSMSSEKSKEPSDLSPETVKTIITTIFIVAVIFMIFIAGPIIRTKGEIGGRPATPEDFNAPVRVQSVDTENK